jgi:hypothetical protein
MVPVWRPTRAVPGSGWPTAYALATSNAFTSDGSDGHFAWCLRQLSRPDITAVLGI